jgi:hypothetical protein
LSNDYYGSKIDGSVDLLEELVKGWFPDFQVVKMQTPLMMPKKLQISRKVHPIDGKFKCSCKIFAKIVPIPKNTILCEKIHSTPFRN